MSYCGSKVPARGWHGLSDFPVSRTESQVSVSFLNYPICDVLTQNQPTAPTQPLGLTLVFTLPQGLILSQGLWLGLVQEWCFLEGESEAAAVSSCQGPSTTCPGFLCCKTSVSLTPGRMPFPGFPALCKVVTITLHSPLKPPCLLLSNPK